MTEDRYGRKLGGPRNKVYSTAKTVEKVPEDKCRTCGKTVRFTTLDGRLIAVHPTTLERHPCRIA